jgi:Tol biopolymer transport system component
VDLHQHLRDLVARQGPSVIDTAESFRAALDDYLTEDEATTGELNLLVDAVRLGAVHRLLSMLDHGARPTAAVQEAGDAFARDRGTDDLARCRWAVAAIGYALGRIDEGVVRPAGAALPASSAPAPPPTAPPTAAPPRTFPETESVASVPAPTPLAPTPLSGRRLRRAALVSLVVAAVVVAAVLVGVWLGNRDEDPGRAAEGEDVGGEESGSIAAAIPDNSIVLPIIDENGDSTIYAVDADSGEAEQLTDGPADRLPAVSPDRSTLIYVEETPGGSGRPMVMDAATGRTRPLLRTPGSCEYSGRPGFNPAGDRVVILCLDEFGGYVATYVVDLEGQFVASPPVLGEPMGTPTWMSDDTLVWAQAGATEDDPTILWEAEVDGDEARQLTDGSQGWDTHPDWSREAGLLLYSRHPGREFFGDLLTMDAEGEPGPSTDGELWAHPAWSPDGTRVVFTVRDDNDVEQLAVAPIDDLSDVSYVPDLPGEPGVPAWGTR